MGEGQGGERKTASIHPLETFETLAFFPSWDLSYDDGNGSENFPEKWDSRCSKFHRSYSNSSSVCSVMFCTKPDVLLITFFNPIKSHTESLLDTCLSVASPFPALCSQERCQLLEFFLSPCAFRLDDEDSAFERPRKKERRPERLGTDFRT